MSITIKDIAKETGLGSATISAYLNGVPVRAYNKLKIEEAVKKLGYIRNDYARGLKMHSSKTIGVLIPELSNIFATTIISEMEEVLRQQGYGIIVCDCRTNLELEQKSLTFLMSKMVDGLIVMPVSTNAKTFAIPLQNNTPIVVIDRMTDCKEVSHIIINNEEISYRAVKKMLQKGHKHIAIISGNDGVYTARARRSGYQKAMEESGLYDLNYVFDGGLSVDGGYTTAKDALAIFPNIDGFFVTNYEMTVGSIIALGENGKKIGKELGFIGFDDMELSKAFTPRLITVNQPLKEIGKIAGQTILAMINNAPPTNVILEANISQGDSI